MNETSLIRPRDVSMILRSNILRADAKLEAAAMFDRDHIPPGAVGPHVGKIQAALNHLDGAFLMLDGVYGPRTAAAVLVYKVRRNIVDRSRPTQLDGSVDQRTIMALDRELLDTRWHRRHTDPHGD